MVSFWVANTYHTGTAVCRETGYKKHQGREYLLYYYYYQLIYQGKGTHRTGTQNLKVSYSDQTVSMLSKYIYVDMVDY